MKRLLVYAPIFLKNLPRKKVLMMLIQLMKQVKYIFSNLIVIENLKLKCECGGKMEKIRTEWKGIEVRGWKCNKCNEEVTNPSDAQKALEIERARNKNLLTVKLRKVGKSNVVTVPQPIIEAENLKPILDTCKKSSSGINFFSTAFTQLPWLVTLFAIH